MTADDESPWRKFRLRRAAWDEFAKVVGERGRSADLAAYVEYSIEHPDEHFPWRPTWTPSKDSARSRD